MHPTVRQAVELHAQEEGISTPHYVERTLARAVGITPPARPPNDKGAVVGVTELDACSRCGAPARTSCKSPGGRTVKTHVGRSRLISVEERVREGVPVHLAEALSSGNDHG
jgi:hypothetical protein